MSRRVVAVLARATVDDATLPRAMLEGGVDRAEGMQQVSPALRVTAAVADAARAVAWPGMPVLEVATGSDAARLLDTLAALDATEAALVCPDVPDLPPLLLGKL